MSSLLHSPQTSLSWWRELWELWAGLIGWHGGSDSSNPPVIMCWWQSMIVKKSWNLSWANHHMTKIKVGLNGGKSMQWQLMSNSHDVLVVINDSEELLHSHAQAITWQRSKLDGLVVSLCSGSSNPTLVAIMILKQYFILMSKPPDEKDHSWIEWW